MARYLARAITSLCVTSALVGGGAALTTQAASAAPAPAPVSTTLAASLQASATAGSMFTGRAGVVSARVRPVLTTGLRTKPLTPAPVTLTSVLTEAQAYVNQVLQLVNVQRLAHGLAPLKADACATRFAVAQNARIVSAGTLFHQDLGPIHDACGVRRAGENVAYGNVSAIQIMLNWMNSEGHRDNILSPLYTHIGVAAAKTSTGRWYATQVFLTR